MSQRANGGGCGTIIRFSMSHAPHSIPCHYITTVLPTKHLFGSRLTMMTRANSLRVREAGSLISLPVTHDHDPRKHPRTERHRHDCHRGLRRQNSM